MKKYLITCGILYLISFCVFFMLLIMSCKIQDIGDLIKIKENNQNTQESKNEEKTIINQKNNQISLEKIIGINKKNESKNNVLVSFKHDISSYEFSSYDPTKSGNQSGQWRFSVEQSSDNIVLIIMDDKRIDDIYIKNGVEITIDSTNIEKLKKAMKGDSSIKDFQAKYTNSQSKKTDEGKDQYVYDTSASKPKTIKIEKGTGKSDGYIFIDTKIFKVTEWGEEKLENGPKKIDDKDYGDSKNKTPSAGTDVSFAIKISELEKELRKLNY